MSEKQGWTGDRQSQLEAQSLRSFIVPGKFVAKPASTIENALFNFYPLIGALFFGMFVPGAWLEYTLLHGHVLYSVIGLVIWGAFLWIFLLELHRIGRLRVWISAPLVLTVHVVIGLVIAGTLRI
jgi:hypothetical protein